MSERQVIQKTRMPLTKAKLIEEFKTMGIKSTDTILVHTSLSKLGYVIGGALTLIQALQETVSEGTILMPTQTGDNSNPEEWQNPPVSTSWIPLIKEHTPAFDPQSTPTRGMGVVPELFRTLPGVVRSNHPIGSFAVWGKDNDTIIASQVLTPEFGEHSPLDHLIKRQGKVVLIGVGYDSCTLMHYTEAILRIMPKKPHECAVMKDGKREWITYEDYAYDSSDFNPIGDAYEKEEDFIIRKVGLASVRVLDANNLHQYALAYMKKNRK